MRKMLNGKMIETYCNKCGKQLQNQNGIITEGVIHVEEKWGYFSNKDLQMHAFDLCEECYDQIAASFAIPVDVQEYISVEGVLNMKEQ